VDALLRHKGIDVDIQDYTGMTALMWAVKNRSENDFICEDLSGTPCKSGIRIIQLLLEAKADCLKTDKAGNTALHQAANNKESYDLTFISIVMQQCEECYDSAFTKQELLEATNKAGETVLHIAAREGLEEMAHLLLSPQLCGSNVNARTAWGIQAAPMHLAAIHGHHKLFSVLLQQALGCVKNPETGYVRHRIEPDGWYPIHCVTANGSPKAIEVLIDEECKRCFEKPEEVCSRKTLSGVMPIEIAARLGNNEACRLLLMKGATVGGEEGKALLTTAMAMDDISGFILRMLEKHR